ncbi:MAG: hypothetical protein OIN66_09190 [Candidatus Methanoperedens sp.]|nr:hypothetical protein [Candidatus Methanoperedens sp.]
MKKPFILLILLLILLPATSSAEKINDLDVEWESSGTYTLSWTSPSASRGDYTIKAIDFDWDGHASVSVTRRGETQYGVLSSDETTVFNFTRNSTTFQGLKIEADDISSYNSASDPPVNTGTFPCCPEAKISVSAAKEAGQKKPVLELVPSIDWDGRSGYTSSMNIQIKNTGDAQFSEGNITINISGLKPDERELSDNALTYNPLKSTITRSWDSPLLANNSYSINISLKPPVPPDPNRSAFIIKVDAYFRDSAGRVYNTASTSTVSLNQIINIDKKITSATIIGERDLDDETHRGLIGLGKITVVNIYVTNLQGYGIRSVNLTDEVIDGFRLVDNNTKLQWVFDLNGSEKKEFRYEMIAQRTGSFTAPAATAQWTGWGISKTASSSRPSTRVYGAFVMLSKNANKLTFNLNESINISIRLENTGDFPVGINVADILPANTSLVSGNTTFNGYLRPAESVYITYDISAQGTGERELPMPYISFWKKDYSASYSFVPGKNITVTTGSKAQQVDNATAFPTPAPTEVPEVPAAAPKSLLDIISEKAPWLEGAIPIVMLLVTIILMLMLHVLNR